MNLVMVDLRGIECCNCGIVFGVSQEYKDMLVESHDGFYCPKGHYQSYTSKTNCEKAHDKVKALENRLFNKDEEIKSLRGGKNAYKGFYNKAKEKLDELSPNSVSA